MHTGCELLVTDMTDHINSSLKKGKHECIMSFDIAGAFDTAPHTGLMDALKKLQTDVRAGRVVRN